MLNPSRSFFLAALAFGLGPACAGGGGTGGGDTGGADAGSATADAGDRADAAGMQVDASSEVSCAAVDDFGDQGTIDGEIIAGDGYLSIDHALAEGPPIDLLVVELFAGFAPFEDGITTGTFEITGDQTDYNLCGACVSVFSNLAEDNMNPMIYTAQSGTVTVTSIAGNFTGTFVPAGGSTEMVGYVPNAMDEYDPVASCTITGGGAAWDKAIPAAP